MDAAELPGYRFVIQGQYDTLFRDGRPEDALRLQEACAPYLARVLAALNLPDAGRHLDLGSGAGLAALAVARARPALEVVGVDASARAVALAARAAEAARLPNARFEEGDAETPPAGPFDRLSALSLFNLLPDKAAALAAWRAVARPDATLVLTDGFVTRGPGVRTGAGATSVATFDQLARDAGWRIVRRDDLTPVVRRLHGRGAWPWSEYVRPGFRYALVALAPR